LSVGKVGGVVSDFHRLTGATANEIRKNSQSNQAFCKVFLAVALFQSNPLSFFRQALRHGKEKKLLQRLSLLAVVMVAALTIGRSAQRTESANSRSAGSPAGPLNTFQQPINLVHPLRKEVVVKTAEPLAVTRSLCFIAEAL
jgi:hypothetical protein